MDPTESHDAVADLPRIGPDSRGAERRRFIAVCGLILVLCLGLKSLTWFAPRVETDEIINWVVTQNWVKHGKYSLQGTGLVERFDLSRSMYDRPLFHHPPLTSALLAVFVANNSPHAAILVAWLGHALAVIGIALVCWSWRRESASATDMVLWLPVLAVALDPVLTFCSRKLWPDGLLGGFVALGMGLLCVGLRGRCLGWITAAGVALGLAALAKLTAVIVLPAACLLVWWMPGDDRRLRGRALVALLLPVCALIVPWLIWFRLECGVFIPPWTRPTGELIAASSHVARAMGQPWHYYLSQGVMIAPVTAVLAIAILCNRSWFAVREVRATLVWIGITWLALLWFWSVGQGSQMRYLSPAIPGLYCLMAVVLSRVDTRRSLLPTGLLVAVLYGAIHAGFYLQAVEFDDIKPVPEIVADLLMQPRPNAPPARP